MPPGHAPSSSPDPDREGPEGVLNLEEALERARHHARAAAGETLEMVRALLDAAALIANGEPSRSHRLLGPLARLLEGLGGRLSEESSGEHPPIVEAIADALDAEIARWEASARQDPEARAVLRAFLGLRELLWEFGVRSAGGETVPGPEAHKARPGGPERRRRRARVQRVPIEG